MDNVVREKPYYAGEKACISRIKRLLHYAEEFGCKFPKGTAEMLYSVACDTIYPTTETVKAVIGEWNIWKEYLSPGSYSSFVLEELADLFRIHTAGTSSSSALNSYVGFKKGVTIVKEPPSCFSTVVTLSGKLLKDGKEI